MDYEIGSMDGAYKGRLHVVWPFIGGKTLTERQKEYNGVHGFYRARIEHLFARMWHWGIVSNIWRGSGTDLYECVRILLHLQQFCFEDKCRTLHMVPGNTYLQIYGLHLHRRTMMMRMLWVTMGMYVPFVAPSVTLRRCPCVTSVSCNIVQIALTRIHVTISRCFNSATVSCCAHKLLILILYLVDN